MAWFGPTRQVLFYLSTVGADRDSNGSFIITGAPIATGMGGDEAVVPDATSYLVNGERKALAAGLCSTSFGTKVVAF